MTNLFSRHERPIKQSLAAFAMLVLSQAVAPSPAWSQRTDGPRDGHLPETRGKGGGAAFIGRPKGGPHGREFSPPRPLWNRMADAEREHMEAFIQEHFPTMYLELERIKEKNPERFKRRMGRIAPEIRRIMSQMETNPERAALMIKCRRLDMQLRRMASRYRNAEGEKKRGKLRRKFREICAESFDCRHQRRAIEIRELQARNSELRNRHEEAAHMREKLIDQMVKARLDNPKPPRPEHDGGR